MKSDINTVYIATPANVHYEQTLFCAKAGKHVLCEKPLGMTVKENEKMLNACHKANVLLGTAFMMRFHSQHQEALKFIQDETIGKPVYARVQLSCWYPPIKNAWRQYPEFGGGGSLIDNVSHCIDLLQMFFGKISKVSCFVNNTIHDYKSEDSDVVTLFFENGVMGTVDTFFCVPDNCSKNRLELFLQLRCFLLSHTIGQGYSGEMKAYLEQSSNAYDSKQKRQNIVGIIISSYPINMYRAEIEEFSQAIIENRKPSNDALRGIQSQKVLTACYRSAKKKKIIEIK